MNNLFNHAYPYLDEHELNLDWLIAKMKELKIQFDEFKVVNNITFSGQWDITKQYPAWTIVSDNNIGYVSIQPVPVGVVLTNTDYWVEVIDYTAQIAGLQQRVVDLENSKVLFYETVADMIADTDIDEDNIMITSGYYSAHDGGASVYKARAAAPGTYYETLSNGVYAELIVGKSINIKQIGAVGDGTTDDSGKINYAINNYDEILFNNETYYLANKIDFNKSNVHIIGNGSEWLFDENLNLVVDDTSGTATFMWLIDIQDIDNIFIEGLNITFASDATIFTSAGNQQSSGVLLMPKNVNGFIMKNCTLLIKNITAGVSNCITNVWARGGCSDFLIDNCILQNESRKNDNTNVPREGGVLWFLGDFINAKVVNSTIEGDVTDEVFTAWAASTDPIMVENCKIRTCLTLADLGIAVCVYGNGSAIVKNCLIEQNYSNYILIRGGDLIVEDCTINSIVGTSGSVRNLVSSEAETIIKNCVMNTQIESFSTYRAPIGLGAGKLILMNNTFNWDAVNNTDMVPYIIEGSGSLHCYGNVFNTKNTTVLRIYYLSGTPTTIRMINNSYINENITNMAVTGISSANAASQNRYQDGTAPVLAIAQQLY